MKAHLFIPSLIVFILSCKKSVVKEVINDPYEIVHRIKDPINYADTFSTGKLAGGFFIDSIVRIYYGATNRYYFSYSGRRNQIASVNYLPQRHPQSCAGYQLFFEYEGNQIKRFTEISPSSGCQLIYNIHEYQYFPSGALKAITFQNGYTIYEQFFEYGPTGRLAKIYFNGRFVTDKKWKYGEIEYTYDANGNVSQLRRREQFEQHASQRITFIYDSISNPYKGHLSLAKYIPALNYVSYGPLFLSNNNVRALTIEFLSYQNQQSIQAELLYANGRYSGLKYGAQDIHNIFFR